MKIFARIRNPVPFPIGSAADWVRIIGYLSTTNTYSHIVHILQNDKLYSVRLNFPAKYFKPVNIVFVWIIELFNCVNIIKTVQA